MNPAEEASAISAGAELTHLARDCALYNWIFHSIKRIFLSSAHAHLSAVDRGDMRVRFGPKSHHRTV